MTGPATAATRTESADGSRYYSHPVTGEQLISVTTVLGATIGKPYLAPWSAKLAAEFAVDNLAMLAVLVAAKGADEAVKLVKSQAELLRNRKRDAGTYLHDVAEALILWAASPGTTGLDIALPVLPEHLGRRRLRRGAAGVGRRGHGRRVPQLRVRVRPRV
jgi:hypothetical protein